MIICAAYCLCIPYSPSDVATGHSDIEVEGMNVEGLPSGASRSRREETQPDDGDAPAPV